MWVAMLVWSLSQRKHRWYNVWVLLLATVAWWLGECVAIRLGKYEYGQFPAWLMIPAGASPSSPDWLAKGLIRLDAFLGLPRVDGCRPPAASWSIPFPVLALEACLVFAFLRLSFFRLRNKGLTAALAAASFSAVLMVTLAAVLDPVVSTTQWCEAVLTDPGYRGLSSVKLWHWFTNETYAGYWFGVPLVNYAAWFVGMGAFSFLARLDDDGPRGIVREYDRWYKYALAAVAMLAILFLLELPLKIGIDLALVRGRQSLFGQHPVFTQRTWEFVVVALLLAASLYVIRSFGKIHGQPRMEWVSAAPPLVVLAFCLVPVLIERRWLLLVVWCMSAAMTVAVAFLPAIVGRIDGRKRQELQAESGLHG
jgi:hypothetical protein